MFSHDYFCVANLWWFYLTSIIPIYNRMGHEEFMMSVAWDTHSSKPPDFNFFLRAVFFLLTLSCHCKFSCACLFSRQISLFAYIQVKQVNKSSPITQLDFFDVKTRNIDHDSHEHVLCNQCDTWIRTSEVWSLVSSLVRTCYVSKSYCSDQLYILFVPGTDKQVYERLVICLWM